MGQIGRSLRVGRLEFCSSNLDEWAATLADFVLGGLSFWVENPRSCTWQWWLPSRFLVEALFGDWTFSRVKIQDLTMMVGPDDDSVCAL